MSNTGDSEKIREFITKAAPHHELECFSKKRGGLCLFRRCSDGRPAMKNANASYCGLMNLLRALQEADAVSKAEAQKVAARLKAETGADVIIVL